MAERFRMCSIGAITIALAACSHMAVLTEPVAVSHTGMHRVANIAYSTGATRNGAMPLARSHGPYSSSSMAAVS